MSLRHAVYTLMVGVLVAACGLVASLDETYTAPGDGGLAGRDATTAARDSGGGGAADGGGASDVEVHDAPADASDEVCVPKTCADLGLSCGASIPDGCGALIASCGQCDGGAVCGAGGPNKCGQGQCDASVCTSSQCGLVSDGCGGQHLCKDSCVPPMTCGGGGCGGCVQKAECVSGENRWPAWLCDDTGPSRGGGCNRIQGAWFGKAYYCCPQN